jgi:uncharacterized protein
MDVQCRIVQLAEWSFRLAAALLVPLLLSAQGRQSVPSMPVIDVHFHTMWEGPELKEPLTNLVSPKTPDELRRLNIAAFDRYHVVKVVASGDQLDLYEQQLGPRLLPGIPLRISNLLPITASEIPEMHRQGKLAALAEFTPQYFGLEPASPKLEQYWAVAEQLDIPVGIHMGLGPPGAAYAGFPEYRMRLSNPLLLEDVLVRHPKLRVYVCHAGWPFLNELLGLLYAHPQVYVDIAVINWVLPEAEFHAYLRRLVDAGFSQSIMFGSDNMLWPDSIGLVRARTSASFLSDEQKRDILCRNAARFLKLGDEICRH